ncbi:hypothetical protein NHX12_009517, partial [Muraenolepis orangiensis]
MRRREKRLLQVAGLLIAALLFVPNVGLWSLYKDRVPDRDRVPDTRDGPAVAPQLPRQVINRVGLVGEGQESVRRRDWHDYQTMKRDA